MENTIDKNFKSKHYFFQRRNSVDWLWGLLNVIGVVYALSQYHMLMDGYEKAIIICAGLALIGFGWVWQSIKLFISCVTLVSLFAVSRYGITIDLGKSDFFLKYMLASQSAIMWMSALYVMATVTYFFDLLTNRPFSGTVATSLTWTATGMGFIGLLVRWRESYLIDHEIGHIPVSNLYEVFILFSIITALIYLRYEQRYKTRSMGGFVLTVISAAVAFLLWYTVERQADIIQPLVPALNSYWMKIHVPANFIGYGSFSLAAMVGLVYLLKAKMVAVAPQGFLTKRLPELMLLDDVIYRAIALGFAFFTLATILGALWAAEAWGGYWSWDPKETWALIVWLNYAAWLHMRLTKGWRGNPMAWWSIVGFFVTLFAFLGVNMFLSGLHSYGGL
ncbi:MAG TPA: c-type cytochrome biogenesis protein CcsB [Methylococcaceae bacterium]|nr:c-type cytochrome biogenesis protein CcsB [Methylococcaceae bacterium]HIB62416.1 c-type cytochrome biogenesis protein CcsB [Methylococcaceae bacterium]HIN68193.1 c-type cytochrome biogenesis protein CcsB [Methylococcales bacterium]HIO45383.1 c-type cytochrome biogenesis protein CcsB [Methylococcales bacterium]